MFYILEYNHLINKYIHINYSSQILENIYNI